MKPEDLAEGLDSDSWADVTRTLQGLSETLRHASDQSVASVLEPRLDRLGKSLKWETRRALAQALAHYRSGAAPRVLSRLADERFEGNGQVLRAARASLAQWQRADRDARERDRREQTLASELGALREADPDAARRVEALAFAYAAEVVGGIGHDLARSGQTLNLLLRLAKQGEIEEVVRHLQLQASLLAVLAEDSTAFVERSTAPAHSVSVLKCVETALAGSTDQLESSGADLAVRVSPALAVHVPPGQLSRALQNVIRNACEAFQKDPRQVTIKAYEATQAHLGREAVAVEVLDTGPGMKDAEACLLPFHSSKKGGRSEDPHSGLGLAIVQRAVVQACEGKLEIDSTVGQGTIVRMIVPKASA